VGPVEFADRHHIGVHVCAGYRVREALEAGDSLRPNGLDVVHELGPALEAVLAGDHPLRVSKGDVGGRIGVSWPPSACYSAQSFGITAAYGAQELLGLLAELFE
jgi:hypothetical protein